MTCLNPSPYLDSPAQIPVPNPSRSSTPDSSWVLVDTPRDEQLDGFEAEVSLMTQNQPRLAVDPNIADPGDLSSEFTIPNEISGIATIFVAISTSNQNCLQIGNISYVFKDYQGRALNLNKIYRDLSDGLRENELIKAYTVIARRNNQGTYLGYIPGREMPLRNLNQLQAWWEREQSFREL